MSLVADLSHHPETGRVTLRAARAGDAALLRGWRQEQAIRRFQPLARLSVADLERELGRVRPESLYLGEGDRFVWIVLVDGEPAGWITLVVHNWEHGLAEWGYALSTPFHGRRLMRRALEQLLERLFSRTRLERIEARCTTDNLASQRTLEALGFQLEGRLRGYFRLDGKRVDNLLYALLRSDRGGAAPAQSTSSRA